MNSPVAPTTQRSHPAPPRQPAAGPDDDINISEYIDILRDRKWLVAGITMLAMCLGVAYALLSTPIYQSNLLIQVEDAAPDAKGFLGDSASLFDVKTPATGEIQIIRSRMVIGAAVDATRLYIDASPRYVPVIGEWLARRSTDLSTPRFLGFEGYVSGTEDIEVSQFDVPVSLEDGKEFIVTALGNGQYTLRHEEIAKPLTGTVGQLLSDEGAGIGGPIKLLVTRLEGKPGAQFTVSRASRLGTVEDLQRRLQLSEQGKLSNVINATLEDSDRGRLMNILNEIGVQYVRQNVERKAAEAEKTLVFLDEQLPKFKTQLETSEDAYTKFRNKNGTVAFDEEAKGVLGQTVELQTKLLEAQQRRRELAAKYTDINPRVQTIDGQIAAISRELGALNTRVSGMPTMQQDALRLERDVRVNGELYKSLLNNALQMRLVKEGKTGNVRVLDKAVQPKKPVKPQKQVIVVLALLLGLFSGIALAIVRGIFMGGIRSPQEIEAHTGLNVYSAIPFSAEQLLLEQRIINKAPGIELLALADPDGATIESLRSLRIALQFTTLEAGNNRVLITGATPGVGKSFISANFAAILAGAGKKVLLVDADLRKGHIHQQFGVKREHGLSDVLAGIRKAADTIHANILPNLDLLTTGKLPSNAGDMMMSDTMAQLLDDLSTGYDLVIIDTPPVLVASDAAAIAPMAGAILLVARADQTQLGELTESAKRLSHAGKAVSGVLFNAMDMSRRHYGSYGYGGYRYTEYKYADPSAHSGLKTR